MTKNKKLRSNDYHEKTDNLFTNWRAQSKKDGFNDFCEDGLMYKGEIKTTRDSDGVTYWYRQSGNEELLWENEPKRVMFLNKDVNKNPNQDIREWIFRQNETDIKALIYKNIAFWLYGLLNIDSNGNAPNFNDINDSKIFTPFIDKTPIAYINCKKESGDSTISNYTLDEHIELYKDFLRDQILLLDPDIIICGGGSGLIRRFVENNVYTNLQKVNGWMYYDKTNNKLVIDSFHPSYYFLSSEIMYTRMMDHYYKFLNEYPDFKKSCRNLV